jgi:hypothetical protein
MKNNLTIRLLGILVCFTGMILFVYLGIGPRIGLKTPIFFYLGVGGAGALGGYYYYKATDIHTLKFIKYFTSILCGIIVALLTSFISLSIIVNIVGE